MKKSVFLLFSIVFSVLNAQMVDFDKQMMINKEKKAYQMKMIAPNINPNTLNYDLKYQRMDVEVDPNVRAINGSVTSHFIPNASLSSIYFDLSAPLLVSSVTFHGNNLNFEQLPTKEVRIDFPVALNANVLDSLTINYGGSPAMPAGGFNAFDINSASGNPNLYTLSEPYGAQDWFPTKQSLNDKIEKFDFKITTPAQYSVAANGKFWSETALPNNKKLTFWQTNYPMAAYLVAISVTNFTKLTDTIGNPPFPFINYVYPATVSNATTMANINWTKQAMTTFEQYFGPYPFRLEKYGHMEFGYNGVCMEHQTMSSMSSWGRGVIAHELAHQWFGDKVTCGSWNDIWLNEGFAVFGEHLVNEKLLMNNTDFMNYLAGQKNYITSQPGGRTYVPDSGLGSVNSIFNGRTTYAKGGYIVRMIKWLLGDTAFYQAIQDYHNRPNLAYGYANTVDLKNSLLLSTGKDFTEFFNDWVYGQGYPTYDIRWKQTNPTTIAFGVNQTQSHPSVSFFENDLPIKVNGTAGEVAYFRIVNNAPNQMVNFPVTFTVASVQFNYEHQILERNSTVVMDNALSTAEVQNEAVVLYPNPAKSEVFFKGIKKGEDFKIFSADGKLAKAGKYIPNESISISEFPAGTYFIKIKNLNLKFVKK